MRRRQDEGLAMARRWVGCTTGTCREGGTDKRMQSSVDKTRDRLKPSQTPNSFSPDGLHKCAALCESHTMTPHPSVWDYWCGWRTPPVLNSDAQSPRTTGLAARVRADVQFATQTESRAARRQHSVIKWGPSGASEHMCTAM